MQSVHEKMITRVAIFIIIESKTQPPSQSTESKVNTELI